MGTKSSKTTGGAVHKGAPRPRPSIPLCAEEWKGPGAAAVGCTGHLRRLFSPKNKVWSCECAGCRGCRGEGEERGRIQNERHTLPDQHRAESPFILHVSSRGGGAWGRVSKCSSEPLKLTWVASVRAQRSHRGLPYGGAHHLFRNHSKEIQPEPMRVRALHLSLPSDTSLASDWLQRCRLWQSVSISQNAGWALCCFSAPGWSACLIAKC